MAGKALIDSIVSSDQVAAALAAFPFSADAGWMTGQVIGVDGGCATLHTKG